MTQNFSFPLFLSALLGFLLFSSCSTQADESNIPIDGGSDNVVVTFDLSRDGAPATYALDGDAEQAITELDILLFDASDKLNHLPIKGTVTSVDPSEGKHEVTATLPMGSYGNILLLANSRKMVDAALAHPTTPLVEGMLRNNVVELFQMAIVGKWNADTSSPTYVGIPMYGETGSVNVKLATTFNATLLRMLVRVDVQVAITGGEKLALNNVRVYNRNSVGMLFPPAVAGKPHLPVAPLKVKGPLVYDGAEITTPGVSSVGEIYLLESAIADPVDDKKRLTDATCLVVGGFYTPDGGVVNTTVESFYRVDFAQTDAADIKHFYDILRNHRYNIRIISAWGPGEETPEEALNTEHSRIDVEIIGWGDGGTIGGDVDGQNELRVNPGSFTLPYLAHTVANINNKMLVSSTHKDGWKITKITEADGITPSTWLSTDLALNVVQMAEKTVSVLTTESFEVADRVGYIFITSGPRMSYKVKVTQGMKPVFIGKIAWDDYDGTNSGGVNDGDVGLTTITVEQPGVDPQTSTISDRVVTPVIEFYGSATKISVTYKGYVLDVPVANYSFIEATETLTIDDRSLIGKPIHLDKMRWDLAGSYIQVDDIDLNGYTGLDGLTNNWEPIGVNAPVSAQFKGNYDGGSGNGDTGFKIYNFNINRSTLDYIGLFGSTSGATLKKIHIASGAIRGRNLVSGIAGKYEGTGTITGCSNAATITGNIGIGGIIGINGSANLEISSCHNLAGAKITGVSNIGGICGGSNGVLSDCTNAATVVGTGSQIGGISGYNTAGTIKNCQNNAIGAAAVKGASNTGGICGTNTGTISDCTNNAGVDATGTYIGGICGITTNTGTMTNNINKATVKGGTVGGICGSNNGTISGGSSIGAVTTTSIGGNICGANSGTISGFSNTTPITSTASQIGGIAGTNSGTIKDCTNAAIVSGSMSVGGICGEGLSVEAVILNCQNLVGGNVTGTSDYVGGIAGKHEGAGTIIGCSNAATITGNIYVGGIFGSNESANLEITSCQNLAGAKITGVSYVGGICGGSNGVISDCTNAATVVGTGTQIGGISGYNTAGTIKNCQNNAIGAAAVNGASNTGGICGTNTGTILDCTNNAAVDATQIYIGGICGVNTAIINGSKNYAPVTADGSVGGICGSNTTGAAIYYCHNFAGGTISGTGTGIGGICGENQGRISNSSNIGTTTGTGGTSGLVGGIAGRHKSGIIDYCTNEAVVTGATNGVGGIVGSISGSLIVKITSCTNLAAGSVNGPSVIGGIIGESTNVMGIIEDSENFAVITATGGIVGGICGRSFSSSLSRNNNNGAVNGIGSVGGICGYIHGSSRITNCNNFAIITGKGNEVGGICGKQADAQAVITTSHNIGNSSVNGENGQVGGIVGLNTSGTITGCRNETAVTGKSMRIGGICGENNGGIIRASTNQGAVSTTTATSDYIGGIVGISPGVDSEIIDCKNLAGGTVGGGRSYVAGIVGDYAGTKAITNCTNEAAVKGVGGSWVAGIAGRNSNALSSISNCHNLAGGEITGASIMGGISGYNVGTILNCTNSEVVKSEGGATTTIGGICGRNDGTISRCTNAAAVRGTGTSTYLGGISGNNVLAGTNITSCQNSASGVVSGGRTQMGGISGGSSGAISGCINEASVTATANFVGGICGQTVASVSACYNIGAVAGTIVGAIVGSGTNMTVCYFGGGASSLPETAGKTTRFGAGAWPDASMAGWDSSVWQSLGGWNGGTPNYPKLVMPSTRR